MKWIVDNMSYSDFFPKKINVIPGYQHSYPQIVFLKGLSGVGQEIQ